LRQGIVSTPLSRDLQPTRRDLQAEDLWRGMAPLEAKGTQSGQPAGALAPQPAGATVIGGVGPDPAAASPHSGD
jgi:hypothetical protein